MPERQVVASSQDGAVRTITIDSPESRNAFSPTVRDALWTAFDSAAADPTVRAIVLTGAGTGFCAGGDTRNMGRISVAEKRESMLRTAGFVEMLVTLPKPIIAAVHGYAVGAGISLALACDIVIASDETNFSIGFTTLGLVPDMGAHLFLTRALGAQRAKRLIWEGGRFDAAWAEAHGVISEVVAAGAALSAAHGLASVLAAGPTLALGSAKQIISELDRNLLVSTLRAEADASSRLRASADHLEGVAALRARRPPDFSGS